MASYEVFIVENLRDGKPYSPPSFAVYEVHMDEPGCPTTIRSPFTSPEEAIHHEKGILGPFSRNMAVYLAEPYDAKQWE